MYYNKILGAIVGDIVGSTREWNNVKNEDFELLPVGSRFTDDTVMTLAVAEWLMTDPAHSEVLLSVCNDWDASILMLVMAECFADGLQQTILSHTIALVMALLCV